MIRTTRFAFFTRRLFPRVVAAIVALLVAGGGKASSDLAEQAAQTQATNAPYVLFEYMKVDPARSADHRRLEREIWMPIHRERVRQGLIKSWSLWGMRFPGGTSREYDVIAMTAYARFEDVENSYPPEIFRKVHPKLTYQELSSRTLSARKMIRTELTTVIDRTQVEGSIGLPKYAHIGFMKPEYGKNRQYVELERRFWRAIHQERVNRGILRSWTLYQVRFPGGTDRPYSHFTLQLLDKFKDLETQYPEGMWEKVHPTVKQDDIDARTAAARRMVHSDLLTLLEDVR